MIIGKLNNSNLLASVGLGNTFIDIFGMAIYMGLDGALSTLVSQAIGAREYQNCGIYRQRTRIMYTLALILLMPLYISSDKLLVWIGQDHEISI